MIEVLVLNKILNDQNLDIIHNEGLTKDHFLSFKKELQFIIDHNKKYGSVPDKLIFAEKFDDFDFVDDVNEDNSYLSYRLKEAKLYKDSIPAIKDFEEKIREDSLDAIQFLKGKIDKLLKESSFKNNKGVDLAGNSEDRLEEYKERVEAEGLIGISTGVNLMDDYLHGWLPEDFVVLFARTNVGKSWILLYFLIQAWRAGNKVLLYSGEMSPTVVGYRFDTLYKNFNNRSLMNGNTELGDVAKEEIGHRDIDDYSSYIDKLAEKDGFVVVTQRDFGNKKPSVSDLEGMLEYHEAEILGVDQITLMRDEKRGESKSIRYENIAQDLFLMSEKQQKPVLAVHQANRDAVKDKDEEPELHHLKWSGGIEENATRAIGLSMIDGVLKFAIKKNRYGLNNKDVLMMWDINLGLMKPLLDGGVEEASGYGF
jgi:replicative DNA helicase